MAMEDLDIVGPWPDFEGKSLERMLAQESWLDGECDDEANVLWFQVDGAWHKLYFDGDAVFWTADSRGPGAQQDDDANADDFPLADLGEKHGFSGKTIARCDGDYKDEASEIALIFDDGTAITFRNRFDSTTVVVAGGTAGS